MRYTCPTCNSPSTVLTGVEEGWDANGPRGIHVVEKHYACKSCKHEWADRETETKSLLAEAGGPSRG